MVDEAHAAPGAALGHQHELQAGGVDLVDAAEVDLERFVGGERLQPASFQQRGHGVDAELALGGEAGDASRGVSSAGGVHGRRAHITS